MRGLGRGVGRHGLRGVLVLGWAGAVLLVVGIFLSALVYAGVVALIGAALWNGAALGKAHG